MNQRDKILAYMQECGSISQMEAVQQFGCYRLGARIHELKKQGVGISREMEHTRNRYGEPVSFARYRLEEGETIGSARLAEDSYQTF